MTNLDKLNFIQEALEDAIKVETRLMRCSDKLNALHQASLYLDYFKQKEEEATIND